ncbi:hypothetical protein [Rhodoferax ferrireducens]|uniref:hypothetical protein n=1 Tax=Rhodoferax ferrireducens TaxID=192843 RepID=UPI000E0DE007|nr:hypothetical protein [Rhodoferax ferrireducens]
MNASSVLPLHVIPADKLFRVYVNDGGTLHLALWFKCANNGDLVTKPMATIGDVTKGRGRMSDGNFLITNEPELVKLTGAEKPDHLHFTYHPSIKKTTPILRGANGQCYPPKFNLSTLNTLEEVVRHQLATPESYPIQSPKHGDADHKFHAVLNNAYDGKHQPTLTFWVAPIGRTSAHIPDEFILPGCFIYAKISPKKLAIDILIQARLSHSQYTSEGDVHIMAAPVFD